ncbi:MAG TPA: ATP-binding protein [Streptosporangiaceae bacterium]|nr:ATP-binding protein [Streptosporangiaceae bacterium]
MTAYPPLLAGDVAVGAGSGTPTNTALRWLAPVLRMAAIDTGNWPLASRPGALDWSRFPRVATRTPGTSARAVRAGRDFAVATLQRWGAPELRDDVAVVVSELLTNALRHALTDASLPMRAAPVRLGLLQPGQSVICAVADPSQRVPQPRDPGILTESGRGLHVIDALAEAWGFTPPSHAGKVVWALFRPPVLRPARWLTAVRFPRRRDEIAQHVRLGEQPRRALVMPGLLVLSGGPVPVRDLRADDPRDVCLGQRAPFGLRGTQTERRLLDSQTAPGGRQLDRPGVVDRGEGGAQRAGRHLVARLHRRAQGFSHPVSQHAES